MALTLTDTQKVTLTIQAIDAKGNPATLDGIPTWDSSDISVIDVAASPDGLSAVAEAVGTLGTAQVSVTADADLGEGVRSLTGLLDIVVIGGEAVTLSIVAGAPEPQ